MLHADKTMHSTERDSLIHDVLALSQLPPSVGGVHLCSRMDGALLQRDLPGRGSTAPPAGRHAPAPTGADCDGSSGACVCAPGFIVSDTPQGQTPPRTPEYLLINEEAESDSQQSSYSSTCMTVACGGCSAAGAEHADVHLSAAVDAAGSVSYTTRGGGGAGAKPLN